METTIANDIELLTELELTTADADILRVARRLAKRHGIDASQLSTTRCEPYIEVWDGARYDGGPTRSYQASYLTDNKRQQHAEAKLHYTLGLVRAVLLPNG